MPIAKYGGGGGLKGLGSGIKECRKTERKSRQWTCLGKLLNTKLKMI